MNKERVIPYKLCDIWKRNKDTDKILAVSNTGEVFEFNETASQIWKIIDGKRSVEEIIQECKILFKSESEERIRRDLLNLLKDLKENDLIAYSNSSLEE